jgi:hypothetical protein
MVCAQNAMIFPRCNAGAHFNGFRKFFGTWNSITLAMTIPCSSFIHPEFGDIRFVTWQ